MWMCAFNLAFGYLFGSVARAETIVEEKYVDEAHVIAVSKGVEYFIKFEVPQNLKEKYNGDPEKHIFEVGVNFSL